MVEQRLNDKERENWINNHEPLYNWWKGSRKGITTFIREHRTEIDTVINHELHRYDNYSWRAPR